MENSVQRLFQTTAIAQKMTFLVELPDYTAVSHYLY